ncbi:MAG: hypothetical protein ACKO1J_04350 [Tagaea sp.]
MRPSDDPGEREEREAWRARVGDFDKVAHAARALLAGDMGPIAESLSLSGIGRPTIRLDPLGASLDHAPLIALHAYWTARCGPGGAPPPARAIDDDYPSGLEGKLHRLETDATGFDYVFRVYAPAVAAHAGKDWTGWSLGALALKTAGGLGIFYRAMQAASALTRRPVESLHNSPVWISASTWRRFTVPFLDETGAATHFLVATVPIAFRRRTPEEEAEFARRLAPGKPD